MMKASEFRKLAEECMDMAPRIDPEMRPLLISIAEAWLTLAVAASSRKAPAGSQAISLQ